VIRTLTCISCPVGCTLRAEISEGSLVKIEGNRCPQGEAYAREEVIDPKRVLTTSVKVVGGDYPLVSVRTDRPIPKRLILEAMKQVRSLVVTAPIEIGQVLMADLLNTGANLIATRSVRAINSQASVRSYDTLFSIPQLANGEKNCHAVE